MPLAPKSFQDIITFSRDTGNATYYNSSGYLTTAGILNYLTYSNTPENAAWNKQDSFVQTNLLTYSQEFNNAAWTKARVTVPAGTVNGYTAPDGTQTADAVYDASETGAFFEIYNPSLTAVIGVTYTQSYWVRVGTGVRYLQIVGPAATFGGGFVNYDIQTGQVVSNNTFVGSVTAGQNGWYRIVCTATAVGAGASRLSLNIIDSASSGRGDTRTGNVSNYFWLWGAQLVQGAVPGDYQATTAAALPILYADWTGALTARKICQNAAAASVHGLRQSPANLTGSTVYTMSFYAKAGESTKASAWQFGGATFITTNSAIYDLVAGTATGDGSPTIQSVGNGWYRCTKTLTTVTSPVTGTVHIGPSDAAGNQIYNGDGTSGVYITDMQIEVGTTVGPYYETTAFQYNAPRFDYNPATLQPRGLLIEELRANLLTYSNDFSNAAWVALSAKNVAAATTVSPDGNINAWVLTDSSAVAYEGIQQGVAVAVGTTTYTASVFVRKTTGGTSATFGINLGISGGTTVTTQPRLNTDTGAIIAGVGTVQDVGAYWRLSCSVTNNGTAGNTALSISLYPATSAYNTVGDSSAATGSATIYGAQLEANAFASSYIPTGISQVTRAADVARVNTLSPWFNQAGGTIYVQALHGAIPAAAALAVEIGDGTNDNRHAIFTAGTANASYYVFVGGVAQATVAATAFAANAVGKFAAAYAVNDFQTVGNGTLGSSDASGSLPINLTTLFIGNNIGSTSFWNGWILRITYYPRRLTNAELQAITT